MKEFQRINKKQEKSIENIKQDDLIQGFKVLSSRTFNCPVSKNKTFNSTYSEVWLSGTGVKVLNSRTFNCTVSNTTKITKQIKTYSEMVDISFQEISKQVEKFSSFRNMHTPPRWSNRKSLSGCLYCFVDISLRWRARKKVNIASILWIFQTFAKKGDKSFWFVSPS